jgi:hypothetical protein
LVNTAARAFLPGLLLLLALSPMRAQQAAPTASPTPGAGEREYIESFLEYRLQVQLKVEEAWQMYLDKFRNSLPRGRVGFSYHVNPDGKITLVEPKEGIKDNPVMILAHRAIIEANQAPAPFPPSVRARHPSGYFNRIAFAVK